MIQQLQQLQHRPRVSMTCLTVVSVKLGWFTPGATHFQPGVARFTIHQSQQRRNQSTTTKVHDLVLILRLGRHVRQGQS